METIRIGTSITIDREPEEVYAFWHDFRNLPRFIDHLESVEDLGNGRSRWKLKTFLAEIVWDAEIAEERKGELIRWHSIPGGDISTRGEVRFENISGGSTRLDLEIYYTPPPGHQGFLEDEVLKAVTSEQVEEDLKKLKHLMEPRQYP